MSGLSNGPIPNLPNQGSKSAPIKFQPTGWRLMKMSIEHILGYNGWLWSDAMNNRTAFGTVHLIFTIYKRVPKCLALVKTTSHQIHAICHLHNITNTSGFQLHLYFSILLTNIINKNIRDIKNTEKTCYNVTWAAEILDAVTTDNDAPNVCKMERRSTAICSWNSQSVSHTA